MIGHVLNHFQNLMLWGFLATCAMAMVQEGTQHFGWSRISFPFLMGTIFTGNRRRAEWIGFLLYIGGGWLSAIFYGLIFESLGHAGWRTGAGMGFFQGLFMLLIVFPLLPSVHPRMASPYDGPDASRRIESPGFMALHYGVPTPIVHLAGQIIFGLILGSTYSM